MGAPAFLERIGVPAIFIGGNLKNRRSDIRGSLKETSGCLF